MECNQQQHQAYTLTQCPIYHKSIPTLCGIDDAAADSVSEKQGKSPLKPSENTVRPKSMIAEAGLSS
jgi:hypothetical protein